LEELRKISNDLRIEDAPAEVLKEHLSNSGVKRYRCAILLSSA
jgi:hypothetical protein